MEDPVIETMDELKVIIAEKEAEKQEKQAKRDVKWARFMEHLHDLIEKQDKKDVKWARFMEHLHDLIAQDKARDQVKRALQVEEKEKETAAIIRKTEAMKQVAQAKQ